MKYVLTYADPYRSAPNAPLVLYGTRIVEIEASDDKSATARMREILKVGGLTVGGRTYERTLISLVRGDEVVAKKL